MLSSDQPGTSTPSGDETTTESADGPATTPSDPTVKKTLDGFVIPVAPGLDTSDAIDPEKTSTPVSDAVAKIDETGDNRGFGTVLLPPFEVTEAEPVVPSQFIEFLGWGIHTSEVEFTDLERDGFRIDHPKSGKFVTLDGFTITGGDREQRSGGSAIHFVNDTGVSPKQFNLGSLAFRDWVDPVVHCEQGSPFDSVWEHLDFGYDANDGREIVLEKGQALLGTQIGYIGAGNATRDPVFYTDFAGAKLRIGFLNVGGSAGQAIRIKAAQNGHVHVNGINFEPTGSTDDPIISVQGRSSTRFDYIQNTNTEARSMVQLQYKNGNNIIGPLRNNGTLQVGKIEVTDDSVQPSYYFGPASDIETSGTTSAVWSFGDMRDQTSGASDQSQPAFSQYSNAAASDLDDGEFAVDVNAGDNGTAAFLYKTDGTLYRWTADEADRAS